MITKTLISKKNFFKLGLNFNIIKALDKIKYNIPFPIQEKCIPLLLKGIDVLGLAQTGSGKTAAFALPLLNRIQNNKKFPQILILVPTRELAIQISQEILNFSKFIKNIHILAIYGGQNYQIQLRGLRLGPQVIIGTPGRLLDHLKRGSLNLSKLVSLVLDEADEMLKMGFIEDVECIMKKIPHNHQTALFSATMPEQIKKISKKFMNNPQEIFIHGNSKLPPKDIKQKYCVVHSNNKKEVLIRFLEVEHYDAVIIFVRTKNATIEVSDMLKKHGYHNAALNGDMNQTLREKTLEKIKHGSINILVATDIAARGLDITRISLVINYDIPINAESYIHRIGRTGRAGRTGKALLFVQNNERRFLKNIEKRIKANIVETTIPNTKLIYNYRLEKFISKIKEHLKNQKELDQYVNILSQIHKNTTLDINTLCLVLLKLAQLDKPLIFKKEIFSLKKNNKKNKSIFICSYKIGIGRNDKITTKNIINYISSELHINKKLIGKIKIFKNYSNVDLLKNIKIRKNIKILGKLVKIQPIKKINFNFKEKK